MFYLEIDMKSSRYFIFPFSRPENCRYLIETHTKYEADNLLKKLNAKLIKPPPSGKDFQRNGLFRSDDLEFEVYLLVAR